MESNELWRRLALTGDKTPKYRQIQSELERLIAENALPINSRLPGENEFFSRLGMSRSTIRKALQGLEDAHLIYRVQGQGTFVGSKPAALLESGGKTKRGKQGCAAGVVVPSITNEIYPFIISGIEKTLHARHGTVFTANSGGSSERELRLINEMLHNYLDGLVLEPLYSGIDGQSSRLLSLLETLKIPVVLLNNDIPAFECSKIMLDDEGGGRMLTEHLIEHGHRRIAYLYNDKIQAAFKRRAGYRAALAGAGIAFDKDLEISYNDEEGIVYPGYVFTKQLLENASLGVTAIFYFNDDLALQGIAAVKSLNMEVPVDVSVAGYDDIPRSRLGGLQLTTISHPKELLGVLAATLLQEQLDHPDNRIYRKITVSSSMVCRASVAAPRLR